MKDTALSFAFITGGAQLVEPMKEHLVLVTNKLNDLPDIKNTYRDKEIRVEWLLHPSMKQRLIRILSEYKIIDSSQQIMKILSGDNVPYTLPDGKLNIFIYIMTELYKRRFFTTRPRKGYLLLLQKLFYLDYGNSPSNRAFKHISSDMLKNPAKYHSDIDLASRILNHSKMHI